MADYYGNNDWRDYLAHHGILGQKWGRRNGPPYPLDGSDHSASEKKAGWRKSLDDGSASTIRKKKRYVKKESKRIEKSYKKDIKRADRAERRAAKKYNKAVENNSSRAQRLREKYDDARIDSEALKRTKTLEIDRVRNMTLKDIKSEKKAAKDLKKQLKGRLPDSDEFYQQIKKKRENKKELQETKSNKRVTQGERNQIKEQVRKEIKGPSKEAKEAKVKSLYSEQEIKTLNRIDRDWSKAYDTWYFAKGTVQENKKAKATMNKLEAERERITDAKMNEYFKFLGLDPKDKYTQTAQVQDAMFEFISYEPVAVNEANKKKKQ